MENSHPGTNLYKQLCLSGGIIFEMLAVTGTALIIFEELINYSIQFEQVSVPSQEAIQLPFLISGESM